jgi:heterodisulfide reductase subunit A-like polyferredoxin
MITDVSNVPYANPTYAGINSIGRQWVYQYTLATVKETLAYVRGKYTTVPIPGAEVTLNQADLLTDARTEKAALLEQLRLVLEDSSRSKQLEKKSNEEDYIQKTLVNVPLPLYIF